ncbi:Inhibitor of growth protein 3, partial [Geodia barretti]
STVLAPFGGRPVAPTFEGEEAATCVVGDLVLPPFGGRPVAPSFEGEEAATCVVGDWDYTMHYYEDYLEIIEYLPAELKSRLSRICEQDEYVQAACPANRGEKRTGSSSDCPVKYSHAAQLHSISDKTKTFFTLCRKDKSALRDHQYQQLCKEYDKTVKESQEKVKLATQVYDLLERHMRRLEHDLNRFTIELEADTAGITEILEQRSYMLDRPPSPERPPLGQMSD